MKFNGINHVAFATNDMDNTVRFWRDLLGMRLIAGIGDRDSRQYFFEVDKNCMISFFEWPDVTPVSDKNPGSPVKGPFAFDHICFEVENRDELWDLKSTLEAADMWCTEELDNGFIHSIFSTDPNNIQLEFCYRNLKVDLSKDPKIVDPDPPETAREGPEQQSNKWPSVRIHTPSAKRKSYPGPLRRLVD